MDAIYFAQAAYSRQILQFLDAQKGECQSRRYSQWVCILSAAAYAGHTEIVSLLLNHGADVNSTGGNYGSALGAAAYWDNKEIASLLLIYGADASSTCGNYGSALGAAVYWGSQEVVSLLLNRGADVRCSYSYLRPRHPSTFLCWTFGPWVVCLCQMGQQNEFEIDNGNEIFGFYYPYVCQIIDSSLQLREIYPCHNLSGKFLQLGCVRIPWKAR